MFLIVVEMWGLRVRSSSVEIAVWTAFLVGALAMPALDASVAAFAAAWIDPRPR